MILMRKNQKVAEILLDKYGNITSVEKIWEKELLPTGVFPDNYLFGVDKEADGDKLDAWWKNLSIPEERDGIKAGLERLGITEPKMLKILNHGLSLTNFYWIKEPDSLVSWEDVNYFDHPFSKEMGIALLNHKAVHGSKDVIARSPDPCLNGVLSKKWNIIDGKYYLQKSGKGNAKEEVFNEVLAGTIMEYAGIPHAEYALYEEDGEIYCISECLTDKYTELIPLYQLIGSLPRPYVSDYKREEWEYVNTILDHYHVKNKSLLNDMLVVDYIMADTDRHYNNISLLYNENTKEYSLSPVYDTGDSLWCRVSTKNINPADDSITARPFTGKTTFGTWEEQKELITDYISLTKENLQKAVCSYLQNVAHYQEYTENRTKKIALGILERTILLQNYLIEKGISIPEENRVQNEDKDIFEAYIEENDWERIGEDMEEFGLE